MPKITSVEPQKKNPKRFNVFLDGTFAFGADEDLVVDRRLIVGKKIESEDLEKILFEAEVGKLMERMYGIFNIRQRSEKEVRDYLKNLSFKRKVKNQEEISDVVVDLVIQKLKYKRLLNDEEFAKLWVEARSKKKGLTVIKSELYKKGIDREIIENLGIFENLGSTQENVAKSLLFKRLPRLKNLPTMDRKKKAIEFLLRRGFEYDLVKDVVEKILEKEYNNP